MTITNLLFDMCGEIKTGENNNENIDYFSVVGLHFASITDEKMSGFDKLWLQTHHSYFVILRSSFTGLYCVGTFQTISGVLELSVPGTNDTAEEKSGTP
jgi:hypothetical protein